MMSNLNDKKRKAKHLLDSLPHKIRKVASDSLISEKKIAKDVNIGHFAENRSIEIQALTEDVKDVGGNHLAFQKLPRHMRRRAMSHNIKRVPRRIHEQVKSELEKVKAPNKRPSRRFRRKPSNLLSEYERRKRRISWLETHIWHAKRFKMIEKWGYRLPLHPNEKSIRACYRAVRRHCLVQDVSFESYIELKGDRESIVSGLDHLTSGETGLTFAARLTSRGTRQGLLVLYCYDCYPCQAIGFVTYLWRPQVNVNDKAVQNSTLWLCCQPAFQAEVMRELNKCFRPTMRKENNAPEKQPACEDNTETRFVKTGCNVVITSLKDHLVKFRLFGPVSTFVLRETLRLWHFEDFDKELKKGKGTSKGDSSVCESGIEDKLWWQSFYKEEQNQLINKQQNEAWAAAMACQSPSEAPPHCVISAVVRDPRLLLPPRREKIFPTEKDYTMRKLPKEIFSAAEVSDSPLWEESVRHNVKVTKVLEKDLNELKSKHLVPGTPLEMGEKESRVPVILIQRPGSSPLPSPSASSSVQEGYGSGWDLLLPAGWAMAFWVALVYRGARVGGLREAHSISLQARLLNQVQDIPDSAAGKLEILSEEETMQSKHSRRPPAKRPNYTKLGFMSPFSFRFELLCQEWMMKLSSLICKYDKGYIALNDQRGNKDFYVLRHRRMLQLLNSALTDKKNFMLSGQSEAKSQSYKKNKRVEINPLTKLLSEGNSKQLVDVGRNALVPVSINIFYRGVPASHAHICLPSKDDLKMLDKDKHYCGPVEALHPDPEAPQRKKERKERLRLRRKRKQGKKVHEKKSELTVDATMSDAAQLSNVGKLAVGLELKTDNEENSVESDLMIPSLVYHGSHPVIGFVTKGDFDLGQGQGSGIGFCSVSALLHIIAEQRRQKNCFVLVRNPKSTQYRFASISIVL